MLIEGLPLSASSGVLEAFAQPYVKLPDWLISVLDQHSGTRYRRLIEGRDLAHRFAVLLTCEFSMIHAKCGNMHSNRAFSATKFL